ncbi:MAG TPA: lipopolysaccharide biosynthesis protein [Terriglobales bacterium]|jgi:polysaccharide chain length determinant protein (PEP-CTERM system associated)
MLGHRELTLEDYLDILRRRYWLLVVPGIVVAAIAWGVSLYLPAKYVSQTLVLIQQPRVPDDYVKPVVSEDLNNRLASMKEQILSRTRLEPIIANFNLYSKLDREERVEEMRKAVDVKPVRSAPGTRANTLPGFYISFTADNAEIAQKVCNEITSMFLTENLKAREQTAQGTTDFIKSQLEEAKRSLDEQDRKLADFQRKYFGELPSQEQSNTNVLQSLNTQLDANTQTLTRLQSERTYIQTMLAQATGENTQEPSGPAPAPVESSASPALTTELEKLQMAETALEARYTPDHPDVIKLKRDIEAMKKRVADEEKPSATPSTATTAHKRKESLSVAQMKAQILVIDKQMDERHTAQDKIEHKIAQMQARIQSSPAVQEEYKQVTRDYQQALNFYNDLLGKKDHSEMATDLERKQQGEQFTIMDYANKPDHPTFPNPGLFASGGFAGGIMLGLLLIGMLEYRDRSLRTERDIFAFTNLPTIGTIPMFEIVEANRRSMPWKRAKAELPESARP